MSIDIAHTVLFADLFLSALGAEADMRKALHIARCVDGSRSRVCHSPCSTPRLWRPLYTCMCTREPNEAGYVTAA